MAWRHWALIVAALLSAGCQSAPTSSNGGAGSKEAVNTKGPIGVNDPWPAYVRTKPSPLRVSGDYVHEGTGLVFPVNAGPFVRDKIMRFDNDGLDIAANYQLPNTYRQKILVSVYLYPITGSMPGITSARAASEDACLAEFKDVEDVALYMFINPKLTAEKAVSAPHRDFKPGRLAVFDADGGRNFPVFTGRVRSESYVFCGRNPLWVLKYRVTYEQSAEVSSSLDALFAAVPR
jgi:hypothetical protein